MAQASTSGSNRWGLPGTDIAALKETLYSQQLLLQKLYTELDEEREASAIATSEAMSMILRLQEEKATVQMEANQYKRLVEEKMCLAEESLVAFEDIMYQKEMEISNLESQLLAYRCKLVRMGCNDPDNMFMGDLVLTRCESFNDEIDYHGNIRRNNSLPLIRLKDSLRRRPSNDRERSLVPVSDYSRLTDEETDEEENNYIKTKLEKSTDRDAIWEQICKLDEQVKEISECQSPASPSAIPKDVYGSVSLLTQASLATSYQRLSERVSEMCEEAKYPGNFIEKVASVKPTWSSNVHDVFEVPQTSETSIAGRYRENRVRKSVLEKKTRLLRAYTASPETLYMHLKDETDLVKNTGFCANDDNRLTSLRDVTNIDTQLSLVPPTSRYSKFQAEVQQLSRRVETLEVQRNSTRQEISSEGEVGVNLLREISEQLNLIQMEMRNLKIIKSTPPDDDTDLLPVMEAMLHFWL